MGWITDILKEVPMAAVQRERLELAEAKHEFETQRITAERDDFKAKWEASEKILAAEQKDHAVTKGLFEAANKRIEKFTRTPRPPPEITIDFGPPIPPIH